MRKQGLKAVISEIEELRKTLKSPLGKKDVDVLAFKKEIDSLLEKIPLTRIRTAKMLYKQWCAEWLDEKRVIEQAYRAFGSRMKSKYSYTNFKTASVVLLYLYGYVSDMELKTSKGSYAGLEQLFLRHREDLQEIKEIDDALKKAKFGGHIPMNTSCLSIGASIAFTIAVRSIIEVMERLHTDEDYRKGHYAGGFIDWDEAILLSWLSPKLRLSGKIKKGEKK